MREDGRLYRFAMAVLGPAQCGPYGPAGPPPAPRLRNARGKLLNAKQIAKLRLAGVTEKVIGDAGLGESVYPV